MLSFVLCTGPLYGWGEYSHFKGKVLLTATLTIDESNFISIPRSSLGFNGASYFCKPIAVTSQVPVMEVLKGICYSFVTSELPNVNIRTPSVNCTSGNVIFTLRSTEFSVIEDIYNNHLAGKLSAKLAGALSFGFGKLLNTTANFSVQTSMDINEISEYRNVFMPFQGLGVCTLDFSPVNEFVVSSTSYIIITTMLIPYSLTLFCAIAMYVKYHTGAVNPCFSDVMYLRIIYVCGSLALILCLPYYVINYMNMHSAYVSKEANFVCTLLFYNSSLLVAIPYFLYRFPSIRFRRRRERCTQAETIMLNGFCEESSTSRNSIKYDSV
ncbi:hypothetical protein FSP39_006438 [Pinctada imbricata]|uniref:Uncharacterized protein n=1 Tax=Pinctada imbricata TaxID=66713 RepID=A0AA88YMR6_PINIB|nr:hypothetical protein FSP39_006438 [Pinctada imbricata]